VAKDSSKGKKVDNIDTYLDTSKLFPAFLEGKEVLYKKKDYINDPEVRKYYDLFQKYIDEKNPKNLFKALVINDSILWDGKNKCEKYIIRNLKNGNQKFYPGSYHYFFKTNNKLPDYYILWATINYWLFKYSWFPRDDPNNELKDVMNEYKKALDKISPILVKQVKHRYVISLCNKVKDEKHPDFLIHGLPTTNSKDGGKNKVTLEAYSCYAFLCEFNRIKEALEPVLGKTKFKKNFFSSTNNEPKLNKLKKINELIKPLEYEIYDDESGLINISDINHIVASVLALRHISRCKYTDKIEVDRIYNLYMELKY